MYPVNFGIEKEYLELIKEWEISYFLLVGNLLKRLYKLYILFRKHKKQIYVFIDSRGVMLYQFDNQYKCHNYWTG